MDTNLPHDFKPLALVGLLLLITVGIGFFPAKWFGIKIPDSSYSNHIRIDLSQITDPNNLASDTDKDGNITWRELIAQNADYSSTTLAEAKSGATPNPKVIEQLNDPNNLTASFSKNLYTAGLYLKKNGLTDPDSYQEALNQLIAQEAKKLTPTTYSYKDIKIASTETKESLKAYGNVISPILESTISKETVTSDLVAINSFIKTGKGEDLSPLLKNKSRIDGILQKLVSISVPISGTSYHILALNRIAAYRDDLDNLSRASTDPLRSRIIVDNYANDVILILRLFNQFNEYFTVQNVIFSTKEPGYIFVSGYNI